MIQRIQTLHLFLAFLFCVVAMFFPPFVVMDLEGATEYSYDKLNYMNILVIAIGILSLITILLFRNRKLQIKISRFNAIMALAWVVWLGIEILMIDSNLEEGKELILDVAALLPLLTLFAILLALRGIKRDEALVRSADRLR